MIKCPACGEENPPKFRLCGYCGAPLAGAQPASPPATAAAPSPASPAVAPPPAPIAPAPASLAPVVPAAPPAPLLVRKTVTFLFCDLKGSTALGEQLDAEALHEVKERYFAVMAEQITRYGGKIEKYIGDAIMAAFGLPRSREDDALRAVRAALAMQHALIALNQELSAFYGVTLANRTGVNTGEVVANHDSDVEQKMATGDAVNVAARLEQAAPENEIYIGDITYRLVRDAVEVEAVEPLTLKGKAELVNAFRLLRADGEEGLARRHDRPLVGRAAELASLRQAYDAACTDRTARMVTVIGEAGMGKSRLVRELVEHVASEARIVTGRCLSYGDGITFWPLAMVVREAAGIAPGDAPDLALAQLAAAAANEEVAERLAVVLGLSTQPYPLGEINWAARKFFEHLAAAEPLIVLIDDIHWAEPALLDLLVHVLQTAQDAPLLLLCTARYDLIEDRPDWGTVAPSERIVLGPLAAQDAAQILLNVFGEAGLPQPIIDRILQAAAGNPLYAEQMMLMLVDEGVVRNEAGRWVMSDTTQPIQVPATIQALLEARVDKLRTTERLTVEPASVIGVEFEQRTLDSLAPASVRDDLSGSLGELTRKQLIWSSGLVDDDIVYRFHHHLLRETVYNGMTKRARANMHLGFVGWADRVQPERALALEEVMAYHLEQAYGFLRELGPLNDKSRAVGDDAARRLSGAGLRAAARSDSHAAANLLGRAVALLPEGDTRRLTLLPDLGDALIYLGDFERATAALDEAVKVGGSGGQPRIAAAAQVQAMLAQLYSGQMQQGDWSREAPLLAQRLIPVLQAEGANDELAIAWRMVALSHGMAGRYNSAGEALVHSLAHARAGGKPQMIERMASGLVANDQYDATPVPQAIARAEALMASGIKDRQIEGIVSGQLAQLKAMNGDFEAARRLIDHGRTLLKDRGQSVFAAGTGIFLARVELRGGDLVRAEREMRDDFAFLQGIGETYFLSTLSGLLARVLVEQSRIDEAVEFIAVARETTAEDDLESGSLWRMCQALIDSRCGQHDAAHLLADAALDLTEQTESPMLQADAWAVVAQVQRNAGTDQPWGIARERALSLYRHKGDLSSARRLTDSEQF